MKQYINGNEVHYDWKNECFRYSDGAEANHIRPCPKCGELPINDNDACLGDLGGEIISACCGHGVKEGYILYKDGTRKRLK